MLVLEGVIWFRAMSDCSSLLNAIGSPNAIGINRPAPTYTLNKTAIVTPCGTPINQTFTVTSSYQTSCSTQYIWNLGINNGWKIGNNLAPASFTTTTPTITLTSANANILPSQVFVTPILNGTSYPSMNCTTAFTPFTSNATLNGTIVICPGGNSNYTISGLETGNVVTWSSSNTLFATISNGTQNQVTVNGLSQGLVNLIATITNPCGQTDIKTKTLNIGAPVLPNGVLTADRWVRRNFYPLQFEFPNVLGGTTYSWVISPGIDFSAVCPILSPNPAKFTINNLQNIVTSTASVNATLGNCLGDYVITCTVSNICGSTVAYIRYITVGISGTSPCYVNNPFALSKSFKIEENPIKNGLIKFSKTNKLQVDVLELEDVIPVSSIIQGDEPCEQLWPKPYLGLKTISNRKNENKLNQIEVRVYDFNGKKVYENSLPNSTDEMSFKDSNLKAGKYILHITSDNETQKEIIIIE